MYQFNSYCREHTSILCLFICCCANLKTSSSSSSSLPNNRIIKYRSSSSSMMQISSDLFPEQDDVEALLQLYSSTNAGKENVVRFWQRAIRAYCLVENKLWFTMTDVEEYFIVHDIKPSSFIPTFEIISVDKSKILTKAELEEVDSPYPIAQKVVSSAFSFIFPEDSKAGSFVCTTLLNELQDLIYNYMKTVSDNERVMFTGVDATERVPEKLTWHGMLQNAARNAAMRSKYARECAMIERFNTGEEHLLLNYLCTKSKIVELTTDKTVLKINMKAAAAAAARGTKGEAASTPAEGNRRSSFGGYMVGLVLTPIKGRPVSMSQCADSCSVKEWEVCKLKLQVSISRLEHRSKELEERAAVHLEKARTFKMEGNTKQALLELNFKRSIMETRDRIAQALFSLMDARDKIEGTEINKIIADAYKLAGQGLKSVREEANITADSVDEAYDAFQEQMDEMRDIDEVMTNRGKEVFGLESTAEEAAELEAELADLIADMKLSESIDAVNTAAAAMSASTTESNSSSSSSRCTAAAVEVRGSEYKTAYSVPSGSETATVTTPNQCRNQSQSGVTVTSTNPGLSSMDYPSLPTLEILPPAPIKAVVMQSGQKKKQQSQTKNVHATGPPTQVLTPKRSNSGKQPNFAF